MKKVLLNLALEFLVFSTVVFAQQATPSPKPDQGDEDVVKISTVLIQMDVTATDSKGNIIKDLKPEEFEIYENENRQKITNFSFIQPEIKNAENSIAATNASTLTTISKGNLTVPVPPAKLKTENVRRTIAFIIDDISLDFEGVYFTQQALKNFVDKQMQDGDLVAIIRISAGIGMLQQFTSDKARLYAAIKNIRWSFVGKNRISEFSPFSKDEDELSLNDERELKNARDEYDDFQNSVFTVGKLGATEYVINGMKKLPGRKSIMFISNKLSLQFPDGSKNERIIKALTSLIESANRASIVVYTMTAKGMPIDGYLNAESDSYPKVSEGDISELQKSFEARNKQVLDEVRLREGLKLLSLETGGLAIINRKGLSGNIQKMLDDQKGYYLIGYQPDAETFNPEKLRFNQLSVRINRPGVFVRYRSGFFGVENKREAAGELSAAQQLNDALTSPFAENDVNVRLAALFGNNAKSSFVRSFLYIQAKDLTFIDEPDGWKKAAFDIAALTSTDDGVLIAQVNKNNTFRVSEENYKKILDRGIIYNFDLPVKKPGVYQFRVALRDENSKKIGSASQLVEVPDIEKKRLAISGITLGNFTPEEWRQTQTIATNDSYKAKNDTAFRSFKRNSILSFSCTAYNARLDKITRQPNLQTWIRIFRDGKIILEGTPKTVDLQGQKDFERIGINSAISLGEQMQAGEYVLQIIVSDNSVKGKNTVAAQWIDFEITN